MIFNYRSWSIKICSVVLDFDGENYVNLTFEILAL